MSADLNFILHTKTDTDIAARWLLPVVCNRESLRFKVPQGKVLKFSFYFMCQLRTDQEFHNTALYIPFRPKWLIKRCFRLFPDLQESSRNTYPTEGKCLNISPPESAQLHSVAGDFRDPISLKMRSFASWEAVAHGTKGTPQPQSAVLYMAPTPVSFQLFSQNIFTWFPFCFSFEVVAWYPAHWISLLPK